MTKPFDMNRHIIETSLKYDDHNPKHRKELEEWLTRSKSTAESRHVTKPQKPAKVKPPAGRTMNIDITLPPELTKYLGGK
jgi:hypothetical protein